MVGFLDEDEDEGRLRRGFVIDTGQILNVPDGVVKLLPYFGSRDSNTIRINVAGDVLANRYVLDENDTLQGICCYFEPIRKFNPNLQFWIAEDDLKSD